MNQFAGWIPHCSSPTFTTFGSISINGRHIVAKYKPGYWATLLIVGFFAVFSSTFCSWFQLCTFPAIMTYIPGIYISTVAFPTYQWYSGPQGQSQGTVFCSAYLWVWKLADSFYCIPDCPTREGVHHISMIFDLLPTLTQQQCDSFSFSVTHLCVRYHVLDNFSDLALLGNIATHSCVRYHIIHNTVIGLHPLEDYFGINFTMLHGFHKVSHQWWPQ